MARSDWLVKLGICFAIYLRATREKVACRFASVTSEAITQTTTRQSLNTQRKQLNLARLRLKVMVTGSFSMKTNEKGFVYKCKLILRNLTCLLENQS